MARLTADILVDGERVNILDNYYFQCRDTLIPRIHERLQREHVQGKELRAFNEGKYPRLELLVGNAKGVDWDGIMGINRGFSPIASPFLLRFYIGRMRNGYQYQKLENALRRASDEGIRLEEDLAIAWNLNSHSAGLGLGNILPTVYAWNYATVDYARVFPPYKFL